MNDGAHSYSYDQEGNLIYVDGGQTTWDNYDALNRRVLHVTGGYTNYKRYEYDIDGRLAGVWQDEDTYQRLQRYYGPKGDSFAYWTGGVNLSNEQVHYQHTDYLGTVKARTDPNHNTEAYYVDLPFGERAPDLIASTDANTEHYATLDRDTESDTHHAQFRTYEPRIGRWLQPDPYDGSYDSNNPQSLNRYSYVLNNPLGFVDPSGLEFTYICTSYGDGVFSVPYCYFKWINGSGDLPWYCQNYGCGGAPGATGVTGSSGNTSSSSSGGGAGGGTTPSQPPAPSRKPQSPKSCTEQLAKINELVNSVRTPDGGYKGLAQRFRQMNRAGYDDAGHMEQIEGKQTQLLKALEDYEKSGCGDPPDGATALATRPIANPFPRPNRPLSPEEQAAALKKASDAASFGMAATLVYWLLRLATGSD